MIRDTDRLQLARERLCAVQVAHRDLVDVLSEESWEVDVVAGCLRRLDMRMADLEGVLGQPVTPQGLFCERGAV